MLVNGNTKLSSSYILVGGIEVNVLEAGSSSSRSSNSITINILISNIVEDTAIGVKTSNYSIRGSASGISLLTNNNIFISNRVRDQGVID